MEPVLAALMRGKVDTRQIHRILKGAGTVGLTAPQLALQTSWGRGAIGKALRELAADHLATTTGERRDRAPIWIAL
jgi:hypothetical protein